MPRFDPDLARSLFERYRLPILRRCQTLLHDFGDAEDVTQEVFVRVLRSGREFREEADWGTWLWRVATNLCLDRLRSVRRTRLTPLDEHFRSSEARSNEPSPEGRLIAVSELDAALRRADLRTRRIAWMHFGEGLTQAQVGQRLGLSRVTVNRQLKHFRDASLAA